jgi:hypothetical protein
MAEAIETKPAPPDLFTPEERAHLEQRAPETPPEPQAPTPSETTAVEPAPAPAQAPPPSPRQETVPQAALHEERKRRQEAEERTRQIELDNTRWQERFRMWQQTAAPQPSLPPEPDKDIFGAVNHVMREQQNMAAKISQYEEQIATQQRMRQLGEWATQAENVYRQRVPDYDKALGFLQQAREKELRILGKNAMEARQQRQKEEQNLVILAAQQRQNPAHYAFQMALERGYRRQQAPQASQASQAPNPGAPANPQGHVDLNRIAAGQQAASSLTGVGGRASAGPEMTIENLLKMNGRELDAYKVKHPAKYRKLLGG